MQNRSLPIELIATLAMFFMLVQSVAIAFNENSDSDTVNAIIDYNNYNWEMLAALKAGCIVDATSIWLMRDQLANTGEEVYSTIYWTQKTKMYHDQRYYDLDVNLTERINDSRDHKSISLIYDGTRAMYKESGTSFFQISVPKPLEEVDSPGIPNILVDPFRIPYVPYYGRSLSLCLERYLLPNLQQIVSVTNNEDIVTIRIHQGFRQQDTYPESGLLTKIEFSKFHGYLPVYANGVWLHSDKPYQEITFSYESMESIWVPKYVQLVRYIHKDNCTLERLRYETRFRDWEMSEEDADGEEFSFAYLKQLFPNVQHYYDFSLDPPMMVPIH